MSIGIKQAIKIRSQIKAGKWDAKAKLEHEFWPGSETCYSIENNGIRIWVANGFLFLHLQGVKSNYDEVKLSFIEKLIIYWPAMRLKRYAENEERQRNRRLEARKIKELLNGD